MLTRLGQVVSYASFAEFCDHTAAQLDTFHADLLERDEDKATTFRLMLAGLVMKWLGESGSLH
jgi:hypothetical protein